MNEARRQCGPRVATRVRALVLECVIACRRGFARATCRQRAGVDSVCDEPPAGVSVERVHVRMAAHASRPLWAPCMFRLYYVMDSTNLSSRNEGYARSYTTAKTSL